MGDKFTKPAAKCKSMLMVAGSNKKHICWKAVNHAGNHKCYESRCRHKWENK